MTRGMIDVRSHVQRVRGSDLFPDDRVCKNIIWGS